jgi:hypothetical protein
MSYKSKYLKYKKKYLELKNSKDDKNINPYLIITAGPTGSGKGSLPDKIIKYLNLNKNEKVNILIDEIVESQNNYKEEIKKLINNYCSKFELCESLKNKIKNPDDKILDNFNYIYFKTRKSKGCNNTNKTCDDINDEKLKNAFKNGKNVVFETTGTYYPSWLFKYNMKELNKGKYKVIMAWTIADWCELIKRNVSRAVESFKEFIKDDNNSAPRLPDIRSENYKKLAKIINNVFYRIAFNCGKTFKIEFCKIQIRLIVVDNRTKNNTNNILYDSFKGSMSPEVEKVYNFTRLSCDYK